jgi:hypothetical protein
MITVKVGCTDEFGDDDLQVLSTVKSIELTLTKMHDVEVLKNRKSERFCRHDLLKVDEYTPFTVLLSEE